jgi:hypothetical protein
MKLDQTVEDVRMYFRENYGHVDLSLLDDNVITEFLKQSHIIQSYIINLSFERKMDCLYDYILSQGICDVQE